MEDLIKALQIFLKYDNPKWPTHCEHDVMYVNVCPKNMEPEDIKELGELGFFAVDGNGWCYDEGFNGEYSEDAFFMSYKYGSC